MFIEGDISDIALNHWVISTTLLDMGYENFEITYTRTISKNMVANYFRFCIKLNCTI